MKTRQNKNKTQHTRKREEKKFTRGKESERVSEKRDKILAKVNVSSVVYMATYDSVLLLLAPSQLFEV